MANLFYVIHANVKDKQLLKNKIKLSKTDKEIELNLQQFDHKCHKQNDKLNQAVIQLS